VNRPIVHRYDDLPEGTSKKVPEEWRNFPFAQVRGITEPLKVRVITAMSALSTYICKPLQKALWNYLARFPCFSLITQPFSEQLLHQMLHDHRSLFGKDSEWNFVSGDYSAATDNLKIAATRIAITEICRKLDVSDSPMVPHIHEILFEQVLIYPPNVKIDPVLQTDGQLMGSVLSFVILCLINLYTYYRSLPDEIRKRLLSGKLSFKILPVLINGDDILFRAARDQYERWVKAGKQVGFELSQGKNFVHHRFFTVNSLPLEYNYGCYTLGPEYNLGSPSVSHIPWADLDEMPMHLFRPRKVCNLDTITIHGYPNIGLLTGLSKTGSRAVREGSVPLNGWFSGAVLGAMYPIKMTNFFLNYHSREIKRQTTFGSRVLNIYAHPYLGGLGFPVPNGIEPRFSEPQRALAKHLLTAANQDFYGPPSDHPLKPFAFLTVQGAATRSLGQKPGRVFTRLGSPSGPYQNGELLFLDNSTIHSTPLAMAYGDLDAGVLTPSCRLSNSELHRLLKAAHHHLTPMVSVPDMTSFPFRVVSYDPELQTIPQDLVTIPGPPILDTPDSLESYPPLPSAFELWEVPSYPFLQQISNPPRLRNLQDQLEIEEAQENARRRKLYVKLQKRLYKNYMKNFYSYDPIEAHDFVQHKLHAEATKRNLYPQKRNGEYIFEEDDD